VGPQRLQTAAAGVLEELEAEVEHHVQLLRLGGADGLRGWPAALDEAGGESLADQGAEALLQVDNVRFAEGVAGQDTDDPESSEESS